MKVKLVGVTIDGAVHMTGCHQVVMSRIPNKVLSGGFYCVWCALHELEIVVQKCVTSYSNADFHSGLTGLIDYLRRQQNLIQTMKSKCSKIKDT